MRLTTSRDANQDYAERRLPNAESPLQNNEIKEEFSTSEMKSTCLQRIRIKRDRVADHLLLFLTSSYKRMLQTASPSRSWTSHPYWNSSFHSDLKKNLQQLYKSFPSQFHFDTKIYNYTESFKDSFLRYSAHATAPNNAITPTLHIT